MDTNDSIDEILSIYEDTEELEEEEDSYEISTWDEPPNKWLLYAIGILG